MQQRNQELVSCARQLQGLDEERRAALSKTISAVAGLGHGTADFAALLASTVSNAVSQVSVAADVRMFVHQRRVAVMMDELQVSRGR
jgi:4-diphosphocytidyl-2C-methyl-D-erythritol kinase